MRGTFLGVELDLEEGMIFEVETGIMGGHTVVVTKGPDGKLTVVCMSNCRCRN